MENIASSQLPEVDSLPDGFVESPAEPLVLPTSMPEQEKPRLECEEDGVLKIKQGVESLGTSVQTSEAKSNKIEGSFPGLLVEKDGFGSSGPSEKRLGDASVEEESTTFGMPKSGDSGPSAPLKVDGGLSAKFSSEKEQAEVKYETSEKSITGVLASQPTHVQKTLESERAEPARNKKPEATEVKLKNTKRGFKTEKEFIELTLKYHSVIAERDSAIAVRDKLESLCRELQRQNKMLTDECKKVSTEGQNLRLDLSTKFHDAIKDVSNRLEEQRDECLSQFKENEMLKAKLKGLVDQYSLLEQHFNQKLKEKSLELQLAELKVKESEQKMIQEQSQMKLYAEQVSQLLATEKDLRSHLTADGEKFQQFQDALLKSNEVFGTFKQQTEKMGKSIKELKKENAFLKSKCEKTDVTLIELVDERERLKKQLEKARGQSEKLESLCRSLQAERKNSSAVGESSGSAPL